MQAVAPVQILAAYERLSFLPAVGRIFVPMTFKPWTFFMVALAGWTMSLTL
jgi:hypothetical protein